MLGESVFYPRIESMFVRHGSDFHEGLAAKISESDQGSVPVRSHVPSPLLPLHRTRIFRPKNAQSQSRILKTNFRKLLSLAVQTYSMMLRGAISSDETWSSMPSDFANAVITVNSAHGVFGGKSGSEMSLWKMPTSRPASSVKGPDSITLDVINPLAISRQISPSNHDAHLSSFVL